MGSVTGVTERYGGPVAELYSRRSFLAGALTAGMLSTSASYLLTRRRSITLTLATGADSTGGRAQLIAMWNQLNPDSQIVVQEINSSTQDQFAKFTQTSADIFNLDVIHIPRFAQEGRIEPVTPNNDISLLAPLQKVCEVNGSESKFWALPWNADVGMLYRRVTTPTSSIGEPPLAVMLDTAGQFVGQLDTVGSVTDEAFVVNVLEQALAQDPAIIDDQGVVSTSLGQWVHALTPLHDALLRKHVVAVAGEDSTVTAFHDQHLRYMRNWPVYYPSVDRTERAQPGTLSVQLGRLLPSAGILGGQSLAVAARSKHRSEAERAIHFLTDTPAQKLLANYGFAPTGVDAYTDPQLEAARPELSLIRSGVEQSHLRPMHANYPAFSDAVKRNVHDYFYGGQELGQQFIAEIQEALR
jgi:multiple sugar transport system substrate-binding protein